MTIASKGVQSKGSSQPTSGRVYLDYQATTPLDPRVSEAMQSLLHEEFGNPHSTGHIFGLNAAAKVEEAQVEIANCIGAFQEDIVFTSGSTEANNLAILGFAKGSAAKKPKFITIATEHKSVLMPLQYLGENGFDVEVLPVRDDGHLDLALLEEALRKEEFCFVSIAAANSEIGTINPINEIGALCEKYGAVFHSDATQALGKMPLDVFEDKIHLMSISGHKIYGPKGVGALIVQSQNRDMVQPLILGGGQQHGLRSGTVPPFLVAGLAQAIKIVTNNMDDENEHLLKMRELLRTRLANQVDLECNGSMENRLPNNLNLRFDMLAIDVMARTPAVGMSTGSACLSSGGTIEPSHVLKAIGLKDDEIKKSLRISVGRFTTAQDIDIAAEHLIRTLKSNL